MNAITIGITTRNRPQALARCLASLSMLANVETVLIFDDGSQPPVTLSSSASPHRVRIIRDDTGGGYIRGRNRLVAETTTRYVLLLDDDTAVLSERAIEEARAVLDGDARVAAVAFAQAEADGRPWPARMQPGRGREPSVVPSFIGFAHLLRRDLFVSFGGYCERLVSYGEEKEYCVRLMDAGYRVVFLPDALIAHLADPAGRSQSRYVRYVIRNDLLTSLRTEPLALALVGFPLRLWRYTRMARGIPGGDRGGMAWILAEVWRALPEALRTRRPVAWSTIRAWRRLARENTPYLGAGPA